MVWQRKLLLMTLASMVVTQTVTQDIRAMNMLIKNGWQFQCASTTCSPFVVTSTSDVRLCQFKCLAYVYCQAASFVQSTMDCKLFQNMTNQTSNLVANTDVVTMIVINETQTPRIQLPLVSVDGIIRGVWNTTVGGNSWPAVSGTSCAGCYPGTEEPMKACDNILSSKYLNFAHCATGASITCGVNTGLYLELQRGSSLVTGLQLCTANDAPDRDPMTVSLEGSNLSGSALTLGSSWTLLYNGTSGLDTDPGRQVCGSILSLNNSSYYRSYRFLVSSKRATESSVQYAEVRLYGY